MTEERFSNSINNGNVQLIARKKVKMARLNTSEIVIIIFSAIIASFPVANSTITVISELTNETVTEINESPASFVSERVTTFYGIQGFLVMADPPDACSDLQPPPNPYPGVEFPISWILLARRYECNFQTKIENAQNAGYSAIIVHNIGDNSTKPMGVEDPSKIVIYACFIGEYDGEVLRQNYTYPSGYFIRIQDDFSLNIYLIPFAGVVGLCFTVMLIFMVRLLWQQVTRWIRERRRSRRRKLPASALKKLPTQKWNKGDPYETCAVCLDDFVEQDKIRVLPCAHGFHMVCIDPWLTKGRRVCPICKRKVVLADERFSDSGSDTDDETAPLIGTSTATATQNPSSGNSTFVQQEGQSVRRAQRRQRERQQRSSSSMNRQLLDSDTSSISSGESTSVQSRIHNSCPVLAEVHQVGRNPRQVSSYDPQQRELPRNDSHSPTYQSCQGTRSQSMSGEENAVYVPERDSEEECCASKSSHRTSVSEILAAGAENAIEIVQHPQVCIVDTFNNPNLETSRTRRSRDSSPGSSSGGARNAIV